MTKYPTGVVNQGFGQGPYVPQSLWRFFSTTADAKRMLAAVQTLFPTGSLKLVDGLVQSGLRVSYSDDNDVKVWVITGTTTAGGDMRVGEWAGDLADRLITPNVWMDQLRLITYSDGRLPSYSNPNPVLFVHDCGNELSYVDEQGNFQIGNFCELAWK